MAKDLTFNIDDLKTNANEYATAAEELRTMATDLNNCLTLLKDEGWTTSAGSAFQMMAETNWEIEVKKYAGLLDTLKSILEEAAQEYETLTETIESVKLTV